MNPNIDLLNLIVMQDDLRHAAQIQTMAAYIRQNGFWTADALQQFAKENNLARVCPLIEIISFPDGKLMVHDGHHRVVSTFVGGRQYLRGDEYVFKFWDYSDYLDINFKNRWVTPFDPRVEIRIPDIGTFKKKAIDLSQNSADESIAYIRANKALYVKPRILWTVPELVGVYQSKETVADMESPQEFDPKYFRTEELGVN